MRDYTFDMIDLFKRQRNLWSSAGVPINMMVGIRQAYRDSYRRGRLRRQQSSMECIRLVLTHTCYN